MRFLEKIQELRKNIIIKVGRFGPYLELRRRRKNTGFYPKLYSSRRFNPGASLKTFRASKNSRQNTQKQKKEVKKSIGRFGPYVSHDGEFRSAPKDASFLDLDLKEALKLLAQEKKNW